MNRPKQFFDEIATFRKTLRTINSEYQTGLVKIERLKGSAAYDEEKKKLDENHSTSVKAAQDQAAKGLSKILSEMRTAATANWRPTAQRRYTAGTGRGNTGRTSRALRHATA